MGVVPPPCVCVIWYITGVRVCVHLGANTRARATRQIYNSLMYV